MKKIDYRKTRRKDLIEAARLIRTSINDLRVKNGQKPHRWRLTGIPPLFDHVRKTDPDKSVCAWAGDKLVGYASALVRGRQWYLAQLFVHPRYQAKGVGRKMLEQVWQDSPGMTHSLCTFAFNMQAVSIYSKFGMAPLCDLPWLYADPEKLKPLKSTGLKIIDSHTRSDIKWLNELESKIRGYAHPQEWRLWLGNEKYKLYFFTSRGKKVGYGMILNNIGIAPVGVISPKYMIDVMTEMIRLAKPKKGKKIMLWCPTPNMELYCYLIDIGFRASELEIFMSDTPYPDWQRYVPATLAVL